MNNKRNVISCLFAVGVVWGASSATLTVNQVRQRYPWNGLVDIDYTIALEQGETFGADDNLEVLMIDNDVTPPVTNRAITFLQAPLPMTAGKHRITWNANADGVKVRTDKAEFRVEIAHYSEAYMIIDVSGGSTASVYRTTFVDRPPQGDFNVDEYKTDKIVLRRIHPGSYLAGSPDGEDGRNKDREAQHKVILSKPFYIGIFEITQKQYENVMGNNPVSTSSSASIDTGDTRPVAYVAYNLDIRGNGWPSSANVAAGTFMRKLLDKCRSYDPDTSDYTAAVTGFDLPTESQWEFACRAGTTGAFNKNEPLSSLGRYSGNQTDHAGGDFQTHTAVGSYHPNAFGLYDMHGNVWELCLDWCDYSVVPGLVDPKGPSSGSVRIIRGGSFSNDESACRSAQRGSCVVDAKGRLNGTGFRLCRTLP